MNFSARRILFPVLAIPLLLPLTQCSVVDDELNDWDFRGNSYRFTAEQRDAEIERLTVQLMETGWYDSRAVAKKEAERRFDAQMRTELRKDPPDKPGYWSPLDIEMTF